MQVVSLPMVVWHVVDNITVGLDQGAGFVVIDIALQRHVLRMRQPYQQG